MKAYLTKELFVEAAHLNPAGNLKQQRLHGHSYCIEILATGQVDREIGWLVDYAALKRLFQPIAEALDHSCINDLPGIGASDLAGVERWIWERLPEHPDWLSGVRVTIVGDQAFAPKLLEADPVRNLPARLRFTLEAAQSLPRLPEGHPCKSIHGHSYVFEIATTAMERLESDLAVLYDTLDHRYLNDIEGLDHATCELISHWVWNWLIERGLRPVVVGVQETPSARCYYFGE